MNIKNTILESPYDGIVCAYACPTTEWKPIPFDPTKIIPDNTPSPIKFDGFEAGPDYIISGEIIIFYRVDTPEKRMKLIEAYEALKDK